MTTALLTETQRRETLLEAVERARTGRAEPPVVRNGGLRGEGTR